MTIAEARKQSMALLAGHIDANRDFDQLAAHVLGQDVSSILAHPDTAMDQPKADLLLALVQRRAKHEPLAYILQSQPFYGRDFFVSHAVLVPRPESELLIDAVKRQLGTAASPTIIDVGTGSGCLAISAALELPQAKVIAIDISEAALAVARKNAQTLRADNVEFLQGNLLSPLIEKHIKSDAILANLPYLPAEEMLLSPTKDELTYEPRQALVAEDDGLALIKTCVQQAVDVLTCGGKLYLEMLPGQIPLFTVWLMMSGLPYSSQIITDLSGLDRDVVLTKTC